MAVGTVLAVTDLQTASERYRNVAEFVERFFRGFQSLIHPGRHPKWREVDITGEPLGCCRFPPAAQWIQRNPRVAAASNIEGLKANFARFIDERQQTNGRPPLSPREKDPLFDQFRRWASERPRLWKPQAKSRFDGS